MWTDDEQRQADRAFEARTARDGVTYGLALLPVFAYGVVGYLHLRLLSPPALIAGAAAYAVVVWLLARRSRRLALEDLRRSGIVDEDYLPPD
jgi:hypothetical protein